MRKKLIKGLGIILLIFIAGSILVVKNLHTIVNNQAIVNKQDIIIARYNEMLFQIKSAQAELYRHQAGYTRNINKLVQFVEDFEDNLDISLKDYSSELGNVMCLQCHGKVETQIKTLNTILSDAKELLRDYKKDISIIITTRDNDQRRAFEVLATENGLKLISMIGDIKHIADKMRLRVKGKRNILITRAIASIFATLIISLILAIAVIFLLVRSITKPVDALVSAIRDISSGRFRKVETDSKDEIGFLSDKFNNMAERLQEMNREKDMLVAQLQEFNKNLEERVKEATGELRAAQENLLRSETLAAVGTLVAGVSHEVSTPLNSIIGFTQLVLSELDDNDPIKGDLKAVEQEALRTKRIVQGLLNFARTPRDEIREVSLNNILNEILTLIFYQPSLKKVVLKKDMDKGLVKVAADPSQLKQVFFNLIINAIQSMPEGGELKIKTEKFDKGIIVTISDSGKGIPEEHRRKIFQPFFTTKTEGTDLGLSICYGIIKSHGGEITVESSEGAGTTFRVYIPERQRQWQES